MAVFRRPFFRQSKRSPLASLSKASYVNINIGIATETDTANSIVSTSISDSDFTAFLNDDSAVMCVLVEVVVNISGTETTLYFSNTGYVTNGSDTPANLDYLPIIIGGAEITESISLEGQAGLSFGNIELSNADGAYDDYLDYVWVNREVKVYVGDVRWARSAFRNVFNGIVSDMTPASPTSLSIGLRDKLQRLNTPIIDDSLGGATINKDKVIPVTFGEVFNATPLLADEATHLYQVHNGDIERIIEVRDNGVPVGVTKNLVDGTFTLNQNPSGTITCSVQGDSASGYKKNVANIVNEVVTRYGKSSLRFVSDDVDGVNLSAFATANPDIVGAYYPERANVISVINDFAKSLNAQAVMSREGKLRLLRIELPPTGDITNLTTDDINEKSLKIISRTDVVSSIKLGYCKNYTVQSSFQTGIPAESSALFSDVWVDRLASDATVETLYKLDSEPVRRETQLLIESEVDTESQRLLDLFKVPRTVFGFSGGINLLELELGGGINLTHPRYGLESGVDGMVIKLQVNWFLKSVNVEVIV